MMTALSLAILMFLNVQAPAAKAPALPATPQGKHVQAFLDAFNSGDEKTFVAATEAHMTADFMKKNPADQQAKMFHRMQGDFGTFKIQKVVSASVEEIVVQFPTQDGATGTFTFEFEKAAPFKINSLGVEVRGGV